MRIPIRFVVSSVIGICVGTAFGQLTTTAVLNPPNYDTLIPPAAGNTMIDPVFGSTIKRVSNALATPNAAAGGFLTFIENEYSAANAFNNDNSKFILLHESYFALYDGATGLFIHDLPFEINASSEPRWSRKDLSTIYYHSGNELRSYNISTGGIDVVHTFSGYTSISGLGETDLSLDGDHFALVGDKRYAFVYQISTDHVFPRLDLSVQSFDSVYITPNSEVIVSWIPSGTGRYTGQELFDINMNFLRQVGHANGHKDLTVDTDGAEVLIWTNSNDPQPIPNCQNGIVKITLATAAQTCLLQLDWSLAVHITGPDGNGSAYIDTEAPANPVPGTSAWVPYTNELIQANLDGSGAIRWAHHRSRPLNSYNWQPRLTISRDGTRLLYTSNFDLQKILGNPAEYSDEYLVNLGSSPTAFTPIRINAGGGAYTDSMGHLWSADSNYSGGGTGSTNNTISGTPDPTLFKTWRYSPSNGSLTYTFNGIPNGAYNVTLDFVEAATAVVGGRVFNVSINGSTVLSNFDIYQAAGLNNAYPQTFATTTSTGQIAIQFTPTGSEFPPIISAIAIVAGSPSPTLSSIAPNNGAQGGSVPVTITGTNLTGATIDPLSGITPSGVTVTSTSIAATFNISNTATTGPQNVTVHVGSVGSNTVTFTVNPPPTLSGISPNSGNQGGSVPVTVSGSNLTGATINPPPGVTVSGVTVSSSSISATFNISGTATTGPQSVTVTAGGVTSNAVTFTVHPAPVLTSITPNGSTQGAIITGVTLSGSNLSGATINTPMGITVSIVTNSANSITATFAISSTAPTGPQNVTVTAGGVTSNPVTFTIFPSFIPIRINAGGGTYTDTTGRLWRADSNYNAGNAVTTTNSIAGTPDPALYQNWRASPDLSPLTYIFTSIPNGSRTVILEFADAEATGVGQRVMNVAINGVTVLSNFDIFQKAGANTALVESFPVTVLSGKIVIQFIKVSGRNAIINALAIQ